MLGFFAGIQNIFGTVYQKACEQELEWGHRHLSPYDSLADHQQIGAEATAEDDFLL